MIPAKSSADGTGLSTLSNPAVTLDFTPAPSYFLSLCQILIKRLAIRGRPQNAFHDRADPKTKRLIKAIERG